MGEHCKSKAFVMPQKAFRLFKEAWGKEAFRFAKSLLPYKSNFYYG
jgi:hypothetical protein